MSKKVLEKAAIRVCDVLDNYGMMICEQYNMGDITEKELLVKMTLHDRMAKEIISALLGEHDLESTSTDDSEETTD